MSQKGTLGAKSEEPKMIYLCTAHIFFWWYHFNSRYWWRFPFRL